MIFHVAFFVNSNLQCTDLYASYNNTIDPKINQLTNPKFSIEGVLGLLIKYAILVEY